jgi:hypothetical protein
MSAVAVPTGETLEDPGPVGPLSICLKEELDEGRRERKAQAILSRLDLSPLTTAEESFSSQGEELGSAAKLTPRREEVVGLEGGGCHGADDTAPSFRVSRGAAIESAAMKVTTLSPNAFALEFESEDELRTEQASTLSAGGLWLRPASHLPLFSRIQVTLRLSGRGEMTVSAVVVGLPPGGLALQLDGKPESLVAALLVEPAAPEEEGNAESSTLWDRVRAMTPPQRILLAPKADRMTRTLLVQDSDAQVLFALLKNPRLTIDEVVRVAKSSALTFQAAELILRTSPWSGNQDVRVALIRNPKLPVPIALRILPSLPDSEVRAIARGGASSMQLKQAALKKIQGG